MEAAADQFRDPAIVARCARIAARILAHHGADPSTMRREGGWSNATWSAGGMVLRIAIAPGSTRNRREARLASILPPEVGYPPILESGVTEGHEWVLARRIAGRNLGAVWPTLPWDERIAAVRQLWAKAEAIHGVDPALAAAYAGDASQFYAPSRAQAAA